MHTSPHGPVMRKLLNWCDEAAVVHWSQEGAEPPSWPEAHVRLQQEGRRRRSTTSRPRNDSRTYGD